MQSCYSMLINVCKFRSNALLDDLNWFPQACVASDSPLIPSLLRCLNSNENTLTRFVRLAYDIVHIFWWRGGTNEQKTEQGLKFKKSSRAPCRQNPILGSMENDDQKKIRGFSLGLLASYNHLCLWGWELRRMKWKGEIVLPCSIWILCRLKAFDSQ